MSFFESATKKAYKGHFANLLVMAMSDGEFDPAEKAMITKIAERLELTEKDIQDVLQNPKKWKFRVPKSTKAKIEILTDYVLVMISDGEIAPEEAHFCSYIAEKLGLDPDTMIPHILRTLAAAAPEERKKGPERTSIDADAFLSDQGNTNRQRQRNNSGGDRGQDRSNEKSDEIRIGDFAVSIVGGEKSEGDYFLLDHNQKYAIKLRNYSSVSCDAKIEIDGKDMGTFRVENGRHFTIDRPSHDDGRFTFYELMSKEGNAVDLKANQNLGLVKVTFRPEKKKPMIQGAADRDITLGAAPRSSEFGDIPPLYSAERASPLPRAGGTGLSGKSEKKFTDAKSIEHDPDATVVIHLRLGARVKPANKDEPRELKPHPRSNKVPPPLS